MSAAPFFDEQSIDNIVEDIRATLKTGLLADGPEVEAFEREFADYVHSENAIAVNSGTAALEIMLRLLKIEGKEVVVPTNTFIATPTSVLLSCGKPVFADIDEDTLCVDVGDIARRITSKTVGVIVVHVAGLICPQMHELRRFCNDNNLFLLEDAAHAHGAMIDGRMAGNLCDGGAFSFYPTKVMTTGQGGMITTNDSNMAAMARSVRDHGLNSERIMTMIGDNWCMSEVTAVIGKHQLSKLEEFVRKRNEIARYYENALRDVGDVSTFRTPPNIRHSYYKYPIRVKNGLDRDKLGLILKNEFGIDTGNLYDPPCHLHSWFKQNMYTHEGDLPVAETVLGKVLCLPMHLKVTEEDVQYVVDALRFSINRLQSKGT
jgi:perosamine synthetase